ncbi:MAG: tetratricopeptide repeat protein [Acidobacteria bacterium]|uniref:Tetratricopeptide repeat protein n=1 Tax=Candidatus Polarisedimenticola svalbardensis TaxID=2886004 RepID=A0A8J6XYR8_9BACT|nr:tetratricopeptide repeat protein [Candidatus Polarisedimenticola svalbardensis]
MRVVAGIIAVCLAVAAVPSVAGEPETLFRKGNEAYASGRFMEAAGYYQEILRYGIKDPRVEYNLGNAVFKQGHLGEAILHYRRAALLDPSDGEIEGNLTFAESKRADRVVRPESAAIVKWLVRLQHRLGPDRQAGTALALFWAVILVLAAGLVLPGRWKAWHGWAAVALTVAALVMACSWWFTMNRLQPNRTAVVLVAEVEILAGPGENNATLVVAHEGLDLVIRSFRDDWIQIALPDGLTGWVPREAVAIV